MRARFKHIATTAPACWCAEGVALRVAPSASLTGGSEVQKSGVSIVTSSHASQDILVLLAQMDDASHCSGNSHWLMIWVIQALKLHVNCPRPSGSPLDFPDAEIPQPLCNATSNRGLLGTVASFPFK